MTTVIILLGIVIAAMLAYLAMLDGGYEVRRSLTMQVDAWRVFDKVRDFRSWRDWSPWLMHEPETKLSFSDNADREGGSYTWDGKRVGAGRLTHVKFAAPARIEERIEFMRPFKSVCKVWWEFKELNGQTEVTWCIRGSMPFFLRFMTEMTRQMVAKDYDLGLAMLRGELDATAERPALAFEGEVERPVQKALVIPFEGGMEQMVQAMEQGFAELSAHLQAAAGVHTGPPFTAYHQVNLRKMHFKCDMAIPASQDVERGGYALKELPGGRFFKVSLRGKYDFLEMAWYSAMSHLRMLKLKQDKSRPFYEVYENDPRSLEHTNDILTTLYIPLR